MSVDYNIQTMLRESEGNGLFNKMRSLKSQIASLNEQLESVTDSLIAVVEREGKVVAHVDGEVLPYILTVKYAKRTILNKEELAVDLGVTQSNLNTKGFVELGNEQKVTPKMIEDYSYTEEGKRLSIRKAKKSDLEMIYTRGTQ